MRLTGTIKDYWHGGQGELREEGLGRPPNVAYVTISPLKNATNSTKWGRILVMNKDYQEPSRTTDMEAMGNLKRRD